MMQYSEFKHQVSKSQVIRHINMKLIAEKYHDLLDNLILTIN